MKRILTLSDTHELHGLMYSVEEAIATQKIDGIIHAGDGANHKNPGLNSNPMKDCLYWLNSFGIPVLYSPGNHDTSIWKGLVDDSDFKNVQIVIHESVNFLGLKVFCSPYTPAFGLDWAYNVKRNKIDNYWREIPEDTEILVTHGPPKGILDKTAANQPLSSVGCKSLLNHVVRVEPKVHIFGHLHDEIKESIFNHGVFHWNNTQFINASMVDLKRNAINNCIIFEI